MKLFEPFALDIANQCLWHNGAQIALQPKPFAVLRYLVENSGRLITHDELLDKLWPETYVQPQVLRTYMLELRKVLGDDATQPRYIQTLPKRGYRFLACVTERSESAAAGNGANSAQRPASAASSAPAEPVPAIVDREREMASLFTQFDLASNGQRRVVFLTGEAGIGKTALLDAFCRQLSIRFSTSVARGQCVEGFGSKEEYYPVMEALSQLCASADGERACKILARMAPAWLAGLGRQGEPSATSSPERMPGDLCAALEELAAEKPLLLAFEDLHWADSATLHLISALARRRAPARLLVLVTCRPRETGGDQPLKALRQDLLLRRLCAEVILNPLPKAAVRDLLIRELKQAALPSGLAAFVHQRAEGNPLFVIAILEHLIAQRFLVKTTEVKTGDARTGSENAITWEQRGSFKEMEASVPDGLAQMIEIEIERLTEQEQRLLEAGSLIHVAFPAWAVAAALDADPAETEEACDALARRLYFMQRAGQDELPDGTCSAFYVFAHELYREVLYRRQAVARRARRHIRVAERLRSIFPECESSVAREMALHFEAAGEWRRAIQALRSAAQHAHNRHSEVEAAELLERALRIAENLADSERAALTEAMRDELATV
jgi:predicted ATPase